MKIGSAKYCLGEKLSCFQRYSRAIGGENFHLVPYNVTALNLRMGYKRLTQGQTSIRKHPTSSAIWRAYSMSVSLEESSSLQSENYPSENDFATENSSEEPLAQPLSSDELKSLLADSERERLIKKLSEANQQNRFLKRQALVKLAEEIANSAIPEGSRKINGKYIQSHLLSRLEVTETLLCTSEAVLEKLKDQIKDVDAAQSKEVPLFWCGMAESVQVMGTFDGWSQGEHLSPEYTGSFTKFSTTLLLRPGRYEIKFLVDGEWKLSPEFPTVREGLMENNLLIVK
ncbi:protein PTST, chloroplastic isoform X3 [Ziziphus jujuba]|uniref:Protein PTST, chloroplastic isoform X3 n=1 Tax=Ziziphus jujuba TaxID=326968 RepID=A0ABM4A6X7_ZIZJJ|nr:protein PTST, chloroplastic isoform X3 [Ziziphus jujuba]